MNSQYVQAITKPGQPIRLPNEVGGQRTSAMVQRLPLRMSVQGQRDLVMTRDPVFPLWADQALVTHYAYAVAWQSERFKSEEKIGSSSADSQAFRYPMLSVTDVSTASSMATSSRTRPSVIPFTDGVGAVLGVMEGDEQPWIYIPGGGNAIFMANFGAEAIPFTTSEMKVDIDVEFSQGPEVYRGVSNYSLSGTISSSVQSVYTSFTPTLGATDKGFWARVVSLNVSVVGEFSFGGDWQPTVTIMSTTTTTLPAAAIVSEPGVMPSFSYGPLTNTQVCFFPLVNLDLGRSALTNSSDQITRACRVTGMSVEFANTTAVLNVEGDALCTCFSESSKGTLLKPPDASAQATILPVDKLQTRLGNTIYGYARPGREIAKFNDHSFEYRRLNNTLFRLGMARFHKVASYSMFSFTDPAATTATSLLLNLTVAIEFVTADILLRPNFATGTMNDLQHAINMTHRVPVFRILEQQQTHRIVDRRPTAPGHAPRPPTKARGGQKPKPKPKPAPKAKPKQAPQPAKVAK